MRYLKIPSAGILSVLCLLLAACGPKIDTAPLAGVWATADHATIVIVDSTMGIRVFRQSHGLGPGSAYSSLAGKAKATAADQFAASIEKRDLVFKIPVPLSGNQPGILSLTETVEGKSAQFELHRLPVPVSDHMKALGLKEAGNGVLSVRTQPELSFAYVWKERDGVGCYALTAKDRPELSLHLLASSDKALLALIRNDKDGNAFLLAFDQPAAGSKELALETLSKANAGGGLKFSVSAEQGVISVREI